MTAPLSFDVADGVARIVLNRPQRLNAFDVELGSAWERACGEATTRDDVRAILIAGEGRAFCAGGDVVAMAEAGDDGPGVLARLAETINRGILALTGSDIPVVAAAQGATAGGGLGILLASDYAVIGSDSRVGSLYANIALTPDLSVTAQLARAVGERRALQLVLRNRMLNAQEAVDWGIAAEAVEPDLVRSRAEEVAREWADGPSWALGQAKRMVRRGIEDTMAARLADEAATIGAALRTPEGRDRVQAFAAASSTV